MKLLRCHIDNFGKLTDYTVDFTENPKVFYEPNGWGKSTFAAFIKVMFYGFANEGKRGATLEKERVRYKPWQGGVYGGEILFEVGNKRYLMNRTFGSKEAEDTFALYDGVTNLWSEDYTTNIGEELFRINQESFLRTVFLAQNDCDTATTDSINAKIGNLADNLDDINNYEKVQQVLKDLRNSMSPTRKTGALKKQKETIAELKDELRKSGAMEAAVAELEAKTVECSEKIASLSAERKAVQETWEALTRRKALEAQKRHYESIISQCREKQKLVDGWLAAMGDRVPDREELTQVQMQYKLWQEKDSEAMANALQEPEVAELSRLRACLAGGVPETELLRETREQVIRLESLRLEAARKCLDESEIAEKCRLEEQFAGWRGAEGASERNLDELERSLDESLSCISAYIAQRNGLGAKKATLRSLKAMEQQQRNRQIKEQQESRRKTQMAANGVVIAGVVALAAGGILTALANKAAGIALLCAGAVAVVSGVTMIILGRSGRAAVQDNVQTDESIGALEQEIAMDEEQMAHNRDFVTAVLNAAEGTEADESMDYVWEEPLRLRDKLYDWKDDVKRLQRLWARELDYQAGGYEAEMQSLQKQIAGVLKPYYGEVVPGAMGELLTELSENRERFVRLDMRARKCKAAQDEAAKYRQQVADYLVAYNHSTADLYEGLQRLSGNLNDYEKDCHELDRLKSEKADFEAVNNIEDFEQDLGDITDSEEVLKSGMCEMDEMLSSLNEQLHGYRRQLEDRQAQLEELMLYKEQLAQAEADYEKDYTYYTRIGYVSEYMEKAKESLSARYIGPVLESFRRNYELLAGESGEDFRMDANIHVTRRALGEQRETGAFSAGNRDLINIVLRIALVEAMYQQEKPFLIIDDSFVNLDGKRLRTATEFMKQIVREYQVIYFTCHESRVLTD